MGVYFYFIDFIKNLCRTQKGFGSIFVVVDRLTKVAPFIPTTTIVIASEVVELFIKDIFVNYGLPQEIICAINRKFVSDFWKSLFKLRVAKIRLSLAYHSESDG